MTLDWVDYIWFGIFAAMFIYFVWPSKYDY